MGIFDWLWKGSKEPEWKIRFAQQLALEAEGYAAAQRGHQRASCPYHPQTKEWHHWNYGYDNYCLVPDDGVILNSTSD